MWKIDLNILPNRVKPHNSGSLHQKQTLNLKLNLNQ